MTMPNASKREATVPTLEVDWKDLLSTYITANPVAPNENQS